MFARFFSIGIVAFWLVMTFLMVKRIHFPGSGPTSTVPVKLVLDTVFGQDRQGGQFDLLQGGREIGKVTIIPRERKTADGPVREFVLWNSGSNQSIRWNAIVTLSEDSTSLAGLDLKVVVDRPSFDVEIKTLPGSESIEFVVRRQGKVIADSRRGTVTGLHERTAKALLSSWGFSENEEGKDASGSLKAYEQFIEIAGRSRNVYSLVASLGPERDITIHFTRAGELLRIYSFLDYELRPDAIIIDPE